VVIESGLSDARSRLGGWPGRVHTEEVTAWYRLGRARAISVPETLEQTFRLIGRFWTNAR